MRTSSRCELLTNNSEIRRAVFRIGNRRPIDRTNARADWVDVNAIIEESVVRTIIPNLKAVGARGIVEYSISKIID